MNSVEIVDPKASGSKVFGAAGGETAPQATFDPAACCENDFHTHEVSQGLGGELGLGLGLGSG